MLKQPCRHGTVPLRVTITKNALADVAIDDAVIGRGSEMLVDSFNSIWWPVGFGGKAPESRGRHGRRPR
jgi:hypothetical protein